MSAGIRIKNELYICLRYSQVIISMNAITVYHVWKLSGLNLHWLDIAIVLSIAEVNAKSNLSSTCRASLIKFSSNSATLVLHNSMMLSLKMLVSPGGGGFSLTNGIRGCSKVLRCIFVSFDISMGGLSSHTQCAQFAKLGVFWKI